MLSFLFHPLFVALPEKIRDGRIQMRNDRFERQANVVDAIPDSILMCSTSNTRELVVVLITQTSN